MLLAETTVPVSPGWMEWDVLNYIKDAIYNGLSSVDFYVQYRDYGVENRWMYFNSKEAISNKPVLVIDGANIDSSKDAQIRSLQPDNNFGSDTTLYLNAPSSNRFHCLISFSLAGISVASSATLKLYAASIDAYSAYQIVQVLKLTRADWAEAETTWNSYKSGSVWTTPGGDYTSEGTG